MTPRGLDSRCKRARLRARYNPDSQRTQGEASRTRQEGLAETGFSLGGVLLFFLLQPLLPPCSSNL